MKKSSIIIGFLVILLSAIYWFSRDNQVSVGIKKLTLPSYNIDKVDKIEIETKYSVRLFKEGQAWLLDIGTKEKPKLVKADQNNVKSLLDAILLIKPSHYVTSIKEKYKDLGLENDDKTNVLVYIDNKPVWSLILGNNDNSSGKYAKLVDGEDVFVVRGSFWSLTRNELNDWRDKELFSIREGQVSTLNVASLNNNYLLKKDAEEWVIDRNETKLPKDFRENKSELASLVRSIVDIKAIGFIDDHKDLSSPIFTVTVNGSELSETVSLFKHENEDYLAKKTGNDQIYIISKFIVDRLSKPIDELRDLSLFKFDKATINKITIKSDGIVLTKKDDTWSLFAPKKLPADFVFDPSSADDVLNTLANLHALKLASSKDIAINNSWTKQWLAELSNDKGESLHVFAAKNKTVKDEYLIKGNIDDNIYVIKSSKITFLTQGLKTFRKEEFELPAINENTPGFNSLPVDVQRKLLNTPRKNK